MTRKADLARPRGLFWPTFGLILFLLLWLATCASGFWFLYGRVVGASHETEDALRALQWMTWPFTVLTIAGPLLLILSVGGLRVVRDLLDMQRLIAGLPAQVQQMQEAIVDFRLLRTQIITDVSRVNDATETDGEEVTPVAERPEVTDFIKLYEHAKELFYDALQDHNTAAAEPLIVQRGGANFSQIATSLRDKRAFDKSDDKNRRIAAFVTRAFELERATRRHGRANLTAPQIQELKALNVP